MFSLQFSRTLRSYVELSAIVHNEQLCRDLTGLVRVKLLPVASVADGFAKYLFAARAIRAEVKANGPGILVLNGQADANLVPCALFHGIPTVIIRHTSLSLQSGFAKRLLYQKQAQQADSVVSVAEHLHLAHKAFLPPAKNVYIPNWVGKNDYKETITSPNSIVRVACSGRIVRGKGFVELCEAAWRLDRLELIVFGVGPLLDHLKTRFRGGNISFRGFVPGLAERYSGVDLFVLASHSEACPQSVLEAMAYGLPCLLSDIPAHRELNQNGAGAILFPAGDAASLRRHLGALRDSPARRSAVAWSGHDFALRRHREDVARAQYLRLFESVGR